MLKLRSLSLIYRCDYDEFLVLFDIPIGEAARDPEELLLPRTHLLDPKEAKEKTIIAPTELRAGAQLEKTNLVARMFSNWEEIPIHLLEQMDLRNSLYGYIGKEDYTMFPIIRPASFVQIDRRQTKITTSNWHNDHDRPIYFFELRDRYVCSWCELDCFSQLERNGALLRVQAAVRPKRPCQGPVKALDRADTFIDAPLPIIDIVRAV